MNLRGSDIECCPLFMAFGLITRHEVTLFVDSKRLTKEAETELNTLKVVLKPYEAVYDSMGDLVSTLKEQNKKLFIPKTSNYAMLNKVQEVSETFNI